VGRFQEDGATIEWTNELRFDRIGFCPTICLDNDNYVIMVWQSFTLRQLSYDLGRIATHDHDIVADQPIDWFARSLRDYDYGYNPTIALSPNNGHVLEEHETNRASCRCTLHYHTGVLHKENKNKENREQMQPPREDEEAEVRRHLPHEEEGARGQDWPRQVPNIGQEAIEQAESHV
jgi:hypothetical protein